MVVTNFAIIIIAAAMVASTNLMYDISANQKRFTESQFIRGYLLASLGRGLMHGDTSSTGNVPKTSWKVKLVDFISLQAAWLRLYIDSFGMKYVEQVDKYLPYAFPPSFKVHAKTKWKEYANQLEPVYTSMRNWMFTESNNLIDFGPYRPLVSFPNVRKEIVLNNRKRVLIDVGANGFFASPKYLLDSYTPYLPFTDAIMIEPEPHFSATIPKAYSDRYNITFMQIYAEVGTDSKTDMLKLLPTMVTPEDFVVLKFDVDPNK